MTTNPRPAPGPNAPPQDALLSARALVKSYDRAPALRGVSFTARRGEIVAITGPVGLGQVDPAAVPGRDPHP